MKKLTLSPTGFTITYIPGQRTCASIESEIDCHSDNPEFKAAINALESMIIGHFCAGIDVCDSGYIEGITTAIEAVSQRYDDMENQDDVKFDESMIKLVKINRVNCIADQTVEYAVNRKDWSQALLRHEDPVLALTELQRECKVTRGAYELEVDEINTEFKVEVTET